MSQACRSYNNGLRSEIWQSIPLGEDARRPTEHSGKEQIPKWDPRHGHNAQINRENGYANVEKSYNGASRLQGTASLQMDTKSSKCVHLVEGGTNGPQYVNMAPMGKTSLGRVTHARRRQKTSFTNLKTHGDGSGYLACATCSSGVPKEIVPAGIVPVGNILVGNNLGVQKRNKGTGTTSILCLLGRCEVCCKRAQRLVGWRL